MRPAMREAAAVVPLRAADDESACLEGEVEAESGRDDRALGKSATVANPPSAPSPAFDYGMLASDLARDAREAAVRIRATMCTAIVETGRELCRMKRSLPQGSFLSWLLAEVEVSQRAAYNYMAAAELADRRPQAVAHLPPTVVYALAAPSFSAPVRDHLLGRAEAGEAVTMKLVRETAASVRWGAKEHLRRTRIRRAPGQTKQEANRAAQAVAEARTIEDRLREDRMTSAALSQAAEMLTRSLGQEAKGMLNALIDANLTLHALRQAVTEQLDREATARTRAGE